MMLASMTNTGVAQRGCRGGTGVAQGWHRGGTGVAQGWLSAVGRNLLMEGLSAMFANKHGLKRQTLFAERGTR